MNEYEAWRPTLESKEKALEEKLKIAVEALERCSKIEFPLKAIAGSDFHQWVAEAHMSIANEALKKINLPVA